MTQLPQDMPTDLSYVFAVPPMYTTMRVNTLNGEDVGVVRERVQLALDQDYEVRGWAKAECYLLDNIPDVIVVNNRLYKHDADEHTKGEVIVDESCGMAVLRGAHVYAQGIISISHGVREGDLVAVQVDMDGCCRKGVTKFDGRKQTVGNGVLKVARSRLFSRDKVEGIGVEMTEPLYEAPSLADILPDVIFPQNLPSIVCGHVLNPQQGERILDMCAAPGGKTTHIAALVNNKADIIAIDKSAAKVARLDKNLARCGATCVRSFVFDSTQLVCHDRVASTDTTDKPPYPEATFDRILVDAPCSALGQRPRWSCDTMSTKVLQSYPVYQRKLLAQAVQLLKPGGTLVYSTCTLPLDENEAQVAWLLDKYPSMHLAPQHPYVGGPGFPSDHLSSDQCAMVQRFNPADSSTSPTVFTDTIGFFIAKFTKGSIS